MHSVFFNLKMTFIRPYRSQILAAAITVLIHAVIIVLLFVSPGRDLFFNNEKTDSQDDMNIQFQMLEQLAMPPAQTVKPQTADVKAAQTKVFEKTDNESEDRNSESEELAMPAVKDTLMMAEIKKAVEEIKIILPVDTTVQKSQIPVETAAQLKQTLASTPKQTSKQDAKFLYDNYRLIKNIRILYPYVMKVKQVVNDMNAQLAAIPDNQEKRKLIRKTEKELFSQFEKDVRKMSYSQGKILLKLIARETNETAYGLIKTYKGGLPADFWYTVGLVFQENLKTKYDSIGEDAMLEKVVRKYKQGEIK